MDDKEFIKKRFKELSDRAYSRSYNTFSDFLNLDEQSILSSLGLSATLFGGYDSAERVVAGFGDFDGTDGFPVVCLKISCVNERFADRLTHRDYLGALMNLGVKRELLGDIIIDGSSAYLFCLEQIAEYISDSLTRVKHTSVEAARTDIDDIPVKEPESAELIVASPRPDALISAVYKLSRSEASRLISSGKVFINSRECVSASHTALADDIISVRGYGRFIFRGEIRRTKKDRRVVEVAIFK